MPKVSVSDEVKATVTAEGEDEERQFVEKETKKESKGRNDRGGGSYYQLSPSCTNGVAEDDRWLDWLDQKIALLINRHGVDPRDYGGKSYDE